MKSSQYKLYTTSSAAWDAMRCAIGRATKSIYWEIYILVDDAVGSPFFDLLEKKAKQGLDVKLMLDGVGSFSVSRARIQQLKAAGVDVRFFHERKYWYRGIWKKFISRTHRKILIIDEHIGFIGGVNVQKHMRTWLDIHVRIKGSAVHSLLRAFAKMYVVCGGSTSAVKELLRYRGRIQRDLIEFIYSRGGSTRSGIRRRYAQALLKARERVILFSPYYFPDKQFFKALWIARRRGVRIDLLIPFRTDVRIATYAAYAWFAVMAKAGIRIHLVKEMMHGKGMVVDGQWAMVGSSNLDKTSFYDNYEANVQIGNKKIVQKLQRILQTWIGASDRFDLRRWEKRGRFWRLKEWCALHLYLIWHRNI